MLNPMTNHAIARSQQRGIPPLVVDLLLQFGSEEPAGDGATKVFLDKQGKRRVRAYAGPLARSIEPILDTYIVLGPQSEVITVGHRTEHLRRH